MPAYDVVYFITPKKKSIDQVIDDFGDRRKYKNVHIFFTDSKYSFKKCFWSSLYASIHPRQLTVANWLTNWLPTNPKLAVSLRHSVDLVCHFTWYFYLGLLSNLYIVYNKQDS